MSENKPLHSSLVKILFWVGVAVAAVQTVKKLGLFAPFWQTTSGQVAEVGAIAAAGAIPLAQERLNNYGEKKLTKQLRLARDLRASMLSPLEVAVESGGAGWKRASVHIMEVQKVWIGFAWRWVWPSACGWAPRRFWKVWLLCPLRARWPRVAAHRSVARVGFTSTATSGIVWTKTKGVIGRCWAAQTDVVVHMADFNRLVPGKPRDWKKYRTSVTFNLDFDECAKVVNKYATIIAVPIMSADGKYVGCVVADASDQLKSVELIVEQLHRLSENARAMISRR